MVVLITALRLGDSGRAIVAQMRLLGSAGSGRLGGGPGQGGYLDPEGIVLEGCRDRSRDGEVNEVEGMLEACKAVGLVGAGRYLEPGLY